jgi:hypothetical protein
VRHPGLQKQQQNEEPINFNVNYHSGIIAFTVVKQYHAKAGRMMSRERVRHPPGGTGATAIGKVAEDLAASRSAQLAVKSMLKSAGVRETGAAIGRRAAVVGKGAGWIGAGVTVWSAYQAYRACTIY